MLAHCKELLGYQNGHMTQDILVSIITALSTAVENGESSLNKDATSYDDLLDAFRLSIMF